MYLYYIHHDLCRIINILIISQNTDPESIPVICLHVYYYVIFMISFIYYYYYDCLSIIYIYDIIMVSGYTYIIIYKHLYNSFIETFYYLFETHD